MIIPVLVSCVAVHGIAGAVHLKRVGRVGVKALIHFEVVTTLALGLILLRAFWLQPGVGMNVDPVRWSGWDTPKGPHGVPGSAIVVPAATLQAIPAIPAVGLVLALAVDWFMGIARALGNLIGNGVATVPIAAREGDIDRAQAQTVLDGSHLRTPTRRPCRSPRLPDPAAAAVTLRRPTFARRIGSACGLLLSAGLTPPPCLVREKLKNRRESTI